MSSKRRDIIKRYFLIQLNIIWHIVPEGNNLNKYDITFVEVQRRPKGYN